MAVALVAIEIGDVVTTVNADFISYTLDIAFFCQTDSLAGFMTDAVRQRLAHLAPFTLRVGGTQADFSQFAGGPALPRLPSLPSYTQDWGCNVTAARLRGLKNFSAAAGGSLLFGLNSLLRSGNMQSGAWTDANAAGLLAADATDAAPIAGWELGNEPRLWQLNDWAPNLSAAKHAADYALLRGAIASAYPSSARPAVVGPDLFIQCAVGWSPAPPNGSACDFEYLDAFVRARPDLDALTIHLYPWIGSFEHKTQPTAADFYSARWLDVTGIAARGARRTIDAAAAAAGTRTPPLWAGEGSPDWRAELSFNMTFELAYLDMAGQLAREGVAVWCRQAIYDIVCGGAGCDSRGGFWLAVLWKRLMGRSVHAVRVGNSSAGVRAYAHGRGAAAPLGVLVLNPTAQDATVTVATGARCSTQRVWQVTDAAGGVNDSRVLVNGVEPRFAGDASKLPRCITDAPAGACGAPVGVAARSLAFVAIDA